MTGEEIAEKLKNIVSDQLGVDSQELSLDSNLKEDLQADSLDIVQMIMEAEDQFGIEIEDDAAMNFVTLGDVVAYISTKA